MDIFGKYLEIAMDKKDIEEALRHGPIPIPRNDETNWTGPKVLALIANPVYAGVGPYPPLVDEEKWIKAVSLEIDKLGVELVLKVLLDSLRQSFTS